MKKQKAPKKVSYALIPPGSAHGKPMYALLNELLGEHHDELIQARIALAWNLSWQPDVDGRCVLGKCKKASDLDREIAPVDFVIILRREFWTHALVTDLQRKALLDHELMHATVTHDENGDPTYDARGRIVYRMRKHDLEEFACIAERYGCWKSDLEAFAAALRRSPQQDLPIDASGQPTEDDGEPSEDPAEQKSGRARA